jgi:YrbI family 3-deoxy-D-manno-octulosonate 8-phosphate phosphatase
MQLEQNIKGLCSKFGIDFQDFLSDLDVEDVHELTVFDLEAVCEEYEVDLLSLLFKPLFKEGQWKKKAKNIKLLVLDVDGVLTDGGMYFTENGDQIKKFNTKDGLGIMRLQQTNVQVAFLSSGFTHSMVQKRAEMLGVSLCYVGQDKKLEVLSNWCSELAIDLNQVAYLGDDVNDLECIRKVGFSACPVNAVNAVKTEVDIILSNKGGDGCVRNFIDNYLIESPIS